MSLFESATVLRADHAAQALPGGSKLVLKFSHAELSTSSIGIASVPFGYKAAVDGFELGDAGDELSALWALDFGTELKPQPLLQLVAAGSEPRAMSSPRSGPRSVRVASGVVLLVSIPATA